MLIERLLAGHDGQVLKFEGDGFLAAFNSAHAGLHAAVDLQRTFTAGSSSLAIRVGVHSGFVMGNPEQLMGRNAVLAARIAAQAKGGEILVSSSAREYTQSDPSFHFEERGEYHFKGLHGEHEVFAVRWRD
jgi:class 3 adenylate cyclase